VAVMLGVVAMAVMPGVVHADQHGAGRAAARN